MQEDFLQKSNVLTENASNVKTLKVHYFYNLKRKELEKVAEL